jgi:hypothetical protein
VFKKMIWAVFVYYYVYYFTGEFLHADNEVSWRSAIVKWKLCNACSLHDITSWSKGWETN